jgi:hypothetical protein
MDQGFSILKGPRDQWAKEFLLLPLHPSRKEISLSQKRRFFD